LSVRWWELGQASPRAAQLTRIEELRGMGPGKAMKKLNQA